jgi:hypothetical protein
MAGQGGPRPGGGAGGTQMARYHPGGVCCKREGKPAAAQEVTSLSGELKQAKATIAEQLSDSRASSANLSAAAQSQKGRSVI